jgi:hypothetical protein
MSKSILTQDEYAKIEAKGFPVPYIVEVHRSKQSLLFYGAKHTNDITDPQFKDIEKRWDSFKANGTNPIVLVEGHFDEVSEANTKDREQSITEGGEAQFVVHLARRDDIKVASPEPDRVWEANQLADEFGRDNVVLFYFMRQISWWDRMTMKPDIKVEAEKMLNQMNGAFKWDDVDFSIDYMKVLHTEKLKRPFVWDDVQWTYDITTPALKDHVTNLLSRRSGEIRDEYILKQIQGYWKQYKSPFVIFGSSHAIRLEPALLKLNTS